MSSGFITETEIAEARQRRQEEWEKVRKAEDPVERPEEAYDSRSLYDRLQEQKMKKDLEYEETHKLKNLIRGLDDDEVSFLEMVDKNKMDMEKKQMQEEEKELKEFRERARALQEECEDKKLQYELKAKKQTSVSRPSQKALLGIGIKRKNGETAIPIEDKSCKQTKTNAQNESKATSATFEQNLESIHADNLDKGHFKCVAILPGLGPYNESSDSEVSSGSEDEPVGCEDKSTYDLMGRKNEKKKHNHGEN
uniref:FAM192A/Fyv6 N-terminal domain-containing protein n=1 Tax=Haematobia irritans TaxID=7368 RepID=A0A1L8ECU2_HAEIR